MIKSGENSRTLSFSLSCPPRIPLSSPHPSFLTHTHTHTLCLSISPTHPPIYALKYVMKYDDCWHMGTVCASSACCPSLPHLPHRTLGIGSQSCMNIPGSYVFPPPFFFSESLFSPSALWIFAFFLEMMQRQGGWGAAAAAAVNDDNCLLKSHRQRRLLCTLFNTQQTTVLFLFQLDFVLVFLCLGRY